MKWAAELLREVSSSTLAKNTDRGTGQASTYRRTMSGPMTAELYDAWSGHDNYGLVVVTATWTPLS